MKHCIIVTVTPISFAWFHIFSHDWMQKISIDTHYGKCTSVKNRLLKIRWTLQSIPVIFFPILIWRTRIPLPADYSQGYHPEGRRRCSPTFRSHTSGGRRHREDRAVSPQNWRRAPRMNLADWDQTKSKHIHSLVPVKVRLVFVIRFHFPWLNREVSHTLKWHAKQWFMVIWHPFPIRGGYKASDMVKKSRIVHNIAKLMTAKVVHSNSLNFIGTF